MNNPPLLLKSLNYSVGEIYPDLGIYIGIINNEYLLFVNEKTYYKSDINTSNIQSVPSTIEINFIINNIRAMYYDEILFELHNMLYWATTLTMIKFTLPDIAVYNHAIIVLINRIYE